MNYRTILLLLSLSLIPIFLQAQDPINVESLGNYFKTGEFNYIMYDDNELLIYCTNNYGLIILEGEDPFSPELIGDLPLPGMARGVVVRDEYAYVVDGALNVVSLRDLENPVVISRQNFNTSVYKINIYEDYLYLGGPWWGLFVVSIEDPVDPQLVDSLEQVEMDGDIVIDNDLMYTVGEDSYIWSLENPAEPEQIGHVALDYVVSDVTISGDYAYYAKWLRGYYVVSIEDPRNPEVLDYYQLETNVHAAHSTDEILVLAVSDGHHVFSLDDPEHPEEIALIETEGTPYDVKIHGDLLYTANLFGGVRVYLLENPAEPEFAGSFNPESKVEFVDAAGDLVVAGFERGFGVVSVGDPDRIETAVYENLDPFQILVATDGRYAYTSGDILRIYDCDELRDPELIDDHNILGNTTGLTLAGDYLYLVYYHEIRGDDDIEIFSGLLIFDVSNIDEIEQVCDYRLGELSQSVFDIGVENDLLYLCQRRCLRIYDIGDLENPELIASWSNREIYPQIDDFVIENDTLYFINGHEFNIAIVEDPQNPEIIPIMELAGGTPTSIDKTGDYIAVTLAFPTYDGFRIFDISDLENPVEVGYYNTPGMSQNVVFNGDIACVADWYSLGIYDISQAVTALPVDSPMLRQMQLQPAYPNPFNACTQLTYTIPSAGFVSLRVFNVAGQRMASLVDGFKPAGKYSCLIDASGWSSAVYLARLRTSDASVVRKLVCIR